MTDKEASREYCLRSLFLSSYMTSVADKRINVYLCLIFLQKEYIILFV